MSIKDAVLNSLERFPTFAKSETFSNLNGVILQSSMLKTSRRLATKSDLLPLKLNAYSSRLPKQRKRGRR
jgi:hypothetical protein